ncbi:hypothetical protein MA16_Dca012721 [Dendrobium catenatum]|uniref:Uncharacterized protein n=1 Tax=Dendrobium catenatum TaxID=906689 RepID=A0A2I0V7L8_9ASPA|nr:hypothetical protein MA16_Dca012721 [Dendrobium catenatum]
MTGGFEDLEDEGSHSFLLGSMRGSVSEAHWQEASMLAWEKIAEEIINIAKGDTREVIEVWMVDKMLKQPLAYFTMSGEDRSLILALLAILRDHYDLGNLKMNWNSSDLHLLEFLILRDDPGCLPFLAEMISVILNDWNFEGYFMRNLFKSNSMFDFLSIFGESFEAILVVIACWNITGIVLVGMMDIVLIFSLYGFACEEADSWTIEETAGVFTL